MNRIDKIDGKLLIKNQQFIPTIVIAIVLVLEFYFASKYFVPALEQKYLDKNRGDKACQSK